MHTNNHQKYLHHTSEPDAFHQQTYNDLNLEEVYEQIDETQSAYGKQFFYKYLFDDSFTISNKNIKDDIDEINISTKQKKRIQKHLTKANQFKDYFLVDLFFDSFSIHKYLKWLSALPPILYLIGTIGIILQNPLLIASIIAFCINIYFYAWSKRQILYSIYGLSALKRFLNISKLVNGKESFKLKGISFNLTLKPIRIKAYLSVLNLQFGKDGLDIIVSTITELFKCAFNLEFFAYWICSRKILKHKKQLLQAYEKVAYIDMLIALDKLKQSPHVCSPTITADFNQLQIVDGWHPLVNHCVPNNFSPKQKNTLITGANMSGKSIFIKQIALNVYLGQKIDICFAQIAIIPQCPVYTYLTISDDILNGKSYYYRELERVKEILFHAQASNGLVVIDEIFKGTNRNEQIAMGYSVLNGISETGSIVIASTHDINLLNMLNGFNNYFFEMVKTNEEYVFNYQIQEGKNMPINAITLAKHIGLPNSIVENAERAFKEINN
ncbi:MutS-related protein [Labilibacter marinus]|uniref:MutS-related protein n=1 Tax=Labilibacter marinus TaxID=1477105 RepID=UPI00094FA5A1|nr:hypothetical protein [Labilibacter marinus]